MDISTIWRPEYSVGNQEIDDQHKYLFELWLMLDSIRNQAENRLSLEQGLLSLFDYVEIHFQREEKLLAGHPEINAHRKIHAQFVDKCREFMESFKQGDLETGTVVDFLKDWLINHIVKTDIRYFNELHGLAR